MKLICYNIRDVLIEKFNIEYIFNITMVNINKYNCISLFMILPGSTINFNLTIGNLHWFLYGKIHEKDWIPLYIINKEKIK